MVEVVEDVVEVVVEVVVVQHAEKRPEPGDPGLTEVGVRQAAVTARWLAARGDVATVWSSPLRRARETAAPIAAAVGRPVRVDDRLRERMNWAGPATQPLDAFLAEWAATTRDRHLVPTAGDSSHAAARRFLSVLDDLARRGPGPHAVVTHGGITVDLLRTVAGDDALAATAPDLLERGVPTAALTHLTRPPGAPWTATAIARTPHLRP